MEHVMLPVPVEHLAEFKNELMRIVILAGITAWTAETIDTFLDQRSDTESQVLVEVAKGADRSGVLSDAELATRMGIERPHAFGIVRDLNDAALEGRFQPLTRTEADPGSSGDGQLLIMNADVQGFVLSWAAKHQR